ncbi:MULTISPECIES: hypothetical protein [unclassified Saccharibacter]|uniref:hypothetical protein n=1 Tax=unclassified Saccharibacter TaxID=2648722 RepID=UPI0013294540|nr:MULTISPECIES: hypothetical protein [unclassified Saccharibacter]MXV35823.1 hypothetical protein [Saccharibacter sp. EH611]MXV57944.1 hypothetical protein [Saccharibacter sp. EH70]MXV66339.1 hypothetical protein [Saccharibacter sp. EH60]
MTLEWVELVGAAIAGGSLVFGLLVVPALCWLHQLSLQMKAQAHEMEHLRKTLDAITRIMMEAGHE